MCPTCFSDINPTLFKFYTYLLHVLFCKICNFFSTQFFKRLEGGVLVICLLFCRESMSAHYNIPAPTNSTYKKWPMTVIDYPFQYSWRVWVGHHTSTTLSTSSSQGWTPCSMPQVSNIRPGAKTGRPKDPIWWVSAFYESPMRRTWIVDIWGSIIMDGWEKLLCSNMTHFTQF